MENKHKDKEAEFYALFKKYQDEQDENKNKLPDEGNFRNLDTFNPDEYFIDYHYYEEFDPEKEYTTEKFIKNYIGEDLEYKFVKYTITHDEKTENDSKNIIYYGEGDGRKKVYIIAKEVLNKNLIPYCRCAICVRSIFNLNRYKMCPCCFGCLRVEDEDYIRQNTINLARDYKNSIRYSMWLGF